MRWTDKRTGRKSYYVSCQPSVVKLSIEQRELPAVTARSSLSVLRQCLFQKSSLCLEERPVFLEHLLLQLQCRLHHNTSACCPTYCIGTVRFKAKQGCVMRIGCASTLSLCKQKISNAKCKVVIHTNLNSASDPG